MVQLRLEIAISVVSESGTAKLSAILDSEVILMSTVNGRAMSGLTDKSKAVDQLHSELYGGEVYEYYALGQYIVAAPGVCGGRPTFKYTRLEVSMILSRLAAGDTVEAILENYSMSKLSAEAIYEALRLARNAFLESTKELRSETPTIFDLVPA